MPNISRRIVFLAMIAAVFCIVFLLARQPLNVDAIDIGKVVRPPKEFRQQGADSVCQFLLPNLVANTKPADWPKLGVLPTTDQIKEDVQYHNCVRASIAIYSNETASDTAFYTLQQANKTIKSTSFLKVYENENLLVFVTPWVLQTEPSWTIFDGVYEIRSDSWLIIIKECSTIVSLYIFVNNGEKGSEIFGLLTNETSIFSYVEQVRQQIYNTICPITNS